MTSWYHAKNFEVKVLHARNFEVKVPHAMPLQVGTYITYISCKNLEIKVLHARNFEVKVPHAMLLLAGTYIFQARYLYMHVSFEVKAHCVFKLERSPFCMCVMPSS